MEVRPQRLHRHRKILICVVDITPSNVVFRLRNLDHLNDAAIYRLFGEPRTDELRTCSGEMHGPEAPRYIVGYLDFFASDEDLILDDVYLIDFDQSFHESTPPAKKPGIPIGFLAPEVAVGQPAGRASDVWALGCTMLHLRSGESPFANMDVDAPSTLMRWVIKYLGAMPASWGEPLFDPSNGHLADAGCPVDIAEEPRSLFLGTFVAAVWDLPSASVLEEMRSSDVDRTVVPEWDENKPYPECYAGRFWKPAAIRAHGTYLDGYCDQVDVIIQTLPKIGMREADLLVDLVERIFVYDPAERLGLDDILRHSWLHASETVDGF